MTSDQPPSEAVERDGIRSLVQLTLDSVVWWGALSFAVLARYDFSPNRVDPLGLIALLPVVVLTGALSGTVFGLYNGSWREGSFEEVPSLAKASAITSVLLLALDFLGEGRSIVPLSALIVAGPVALVGMSGLRYGRRRSVQRRRRPRGDDLERVVVFGAGEAADLVLRSMLGDAKSRFLPVALLDDDPRKRHLRLSGVEVSGGREDVADVAQRFRADSLLIAVPSATAQLVMDLTGLAVAAGLRARVLPTVSELIDHSVAVTDIRTVTEADLLGRHEVVTDYKSISGYLTGRRILVTGAGGSIGSELCRQISKLDPASLIMIDRDESALHAIELSIKGRALLQSEDVILLDIRDVDRLNQLFLDRRPHVVFHAAALKHLPLLERFPMDGVRSNVRGTLAVLEAAAAARVERFVNISTDKAANPTSILGLTKRIAERLTAHFDGASPGIFLSVRFGNVLGSRGSVLGTFHAQIAAGGPITVTHPEVTRFFMTIPEAVQLIMQAGAIGRDGEALVLDMGKPVRIADVARRLAAAAARSVEIEYTGLRPGEKLHEELFGDGECGGRPIHPLISHVAVPPIDPHTVLRELACAPEQIRERLHALCARAAEATRVGE